MRRCLVSDFEGKLLGPASTFAWARSADAAGRRRLGVARARCGGFRHAFVAHAGKENDLARPLGDGIAVPSTLSRS